MACESARALLVAAAWLVLAGTAGAAPGDIYTCTDPNGRRLTSDRPIAACASREQRVLNRDGSLQRVIPPTLTAEERADHEAREARRAADRKSQQDLVRRDRNLLMRYPNEAAHHKARVEALDDTRAALERSETRLTALAKERKPLVDETEFYVGRSMPPRLKQQLDANEAAGTAQRELMQNQQLELARINASFDLELARLKKLWAGAPPGSLGPLETASSDPPRPTAH